MNREDRRQVLEEGLTLPAIEQSDRIIWILAERIMEEGSLHCHFDENAWLVITGNAELLKAFKVQLAKDERFYMRSDSKEVKVRARRI